MPRLPIRKTILLVEDDVDLREIVADLLRDAGRHVVEAENGSVALDKLGLLERPCLILLDLVMPRMDGYEFLRRLNERPEVAEFPVLVVSATGDLDVAEQYTGVLGTLPKPFDVATLLSWVNALC